MPHRPAATIDFPMVGPHLSRKLAPYLLLAPALLNACDTAKRPDNQPTPPSTAEQAPAKSTDQNDEELHAAWLAWRNASVPHYEIPEREMGRTFDLLSYFLNHTDEERINFIDVGCALGDYLRLYVQPKVRKPLFSLGIDPIDFDDRAPYSVYAEVAITGRDPGTYDFHVYGDGYLATSSLAKMRADRVTHDEAEKDTKFFHPAKIETDHGVIEVQAVPLSHLIEKHGLDKQTLHFVKVDVQGTDLEAFLSLNQYARQVLFLQIESIYSDNPEQALYEGQRLFKDEKPVLEKLGFRVFNVARFPAGPEADVMWVNVERFDALSKL